MRRLERDRLGLPAVGEQSGERVVALLGRRAARDHSLCREGLAAVAGDGGVRLHRGDARGIRGGGRHRGARLQQVGEREIVVQRLAGSRDRRRAAADREARRQVHLHLRLGHRHAVDEAQRVLLGGGERRARAVGDARRDDQRIGRGERDDPAVRDLVAVFLVEHVQRELDGAQRVAPPVLLGVLLRMGVLERPAIGKKLIEVGRIGGSTSNGAGSRELRIDAGGGGSRARAAHEVDGVVGQVVRAVSRPLVGIGDRAAALQAPFAREADRPVDAARAG